MCKCVHRCPLSLSWHCLSLSLELDWWPASPSNHPVSVPYSSEAAGSPHLVFYMDSGDPDSGLYTYTAGIATH